MEKCDYLSTTTHWILNHYTMPHLDNPTPPDPSFRTLPSEIMATVNKRFIGAVKDEWTLYSDRAIDYTIGGPIGYGASSVVYVATYHPPITNPNDSPQPIPCALKVLDLDSLPPRSLKLLQRETTLMSLSKHPNVLRVRGSWMDGHRLYIATRLMNKGSAADVMRYGWPGGMEEDVARCILQQALKGLNYLHINGFIHRDVKAANLLIDDDGTVLLGDLGVAADLSEDSAHHLSIPSGKTYAVTATAALSQTQHHQRLAFAHDSHVKTRPRIGKRKSFVGTPCWMAPELIEGRQYDSSADIWSFGITALELTQGRPPRSRESPKDVLLRTISDAPPTLNREGGTFKYSRAFKEMVDSCLIKDPSMRPTAEQLLQTPFFKSAKKKQYLINTILKDLPPLTQRQERRAIRYNQTMNTIDSWDFATTIHSPTSTIHPRCLPLEEFALQEDDHENPENVFHFDNETHSASLQPDQREPRVDYDRQSTSSTSTDDDMSTDPVVLSTPPTNTSFLTDTPPPKITNVDPDFELPISSSVEEPSKKGFWSRFTSNVRRTSFAKVTIPKILPPPPVIQTAQPPSKMSTILRRPSSQGALVSAGLENKTTPTKEDGVLLNANAKSKRPATSHGAGSNMRLASDSISGTTRVKRPSSRGALLGGMLSDAKNHIISKS